LVFLNTGVLATEHYGQLDWLDRFQGECYELNNKKYKLLKNSRFSLFEPMLLCFFIVMN